MVDPVTATKERKERCDSYPCRRIVGVIQNHCYGCNRTICVHCALTKGHHVGGRHD